ncbi:MAG: hypothetical protein EG826_02110 [Deltaproteobacteria bacterium]|nr:hypothetical protein [Deltaproteobacteria bacterium]
MNKSTTHRQLIPLNPSAEIFMIWERDGFPSTGWTAFPFQGSCDVAAFETALRNTLPLFPVFSSRLVIATHGLLQKCCWEPADELCPLCVTDLRHLEKKPDDMEAWIQPMLNPFLDRYRYDLMQGFPLRFFLFLLPENSGFFAVAWHHCATDGGGLYDFLRELFSAYHGLVTGARPSWASVAAIHSQTAPTADVRPMRLGPLIKKILEQSIRYPIFRSTQIIGSPDAEAGRKMIRYYDDDPLVQKALRDRARLRGGTVSDLCLAAAKLAMQEWNANHGHPPNIMHHLLTVNQRPRQVENEAAGHSVPLSAVIIPSRPEHRRDPQALLDHVIGYRKRMTDAGFDLALERLSRTLMEAGRILPVGIRYRVLRPLLDYKISLSLSNIGVVWPKVEKGKLTGETAIYRIGNMELLDIYTSLGVTYNNPLTMTLRTFRGRLSFLFSVSRHRISDAEAQTFTGLVMDKVKGYL